MEYRNKSKAAYKDSMLRIAVVNPEKCKPKNCGQSCKKFCPVVKMGKICIEVNSESKCADISQIHCNGCGICTKKCPYNAIRMVNLPKNMEFQTTHRFGPNSFKLHRLPGPKFGRVLGLVGANGTGKTTVLKVLSGKLKPNMGNFENPPGWSEIVKYYRGSSLQNYFRKISEDEWKVKLKPQYLEQIRHKIGEHTVRDVLLRKDETDRFDQLVIGLDLGRFLDRPIDQLSGGELQRFAIALVCEQKADIYMFDEASSYLDVKQRLKAAAAIRSILTYENQVVIVEHDLMLLDYLSDYVSCFYGEPGAYGVVTLPSQVREGINQFLDGYFPKENVRFREHRLDFNMTTEATIDKNKDRQLFHYSAMEKRFDDFHLVVEEGGYSSSQIVVLLGENGTGKSTFIELLAAKITPFKGCSIASYKPQRITLSFNGDGNVRKLLEKEIGAQLLDPVFRTEVLRPLQVDALLDYEVRNLSGGEQQRVAIAACLGKPAQVYLVDEPSAYLDSEQRLAASKVIKRWILSNKKTAFVVEHDLLMATFLADSVIVFAGEPSKKTTAKSPQSVVEGVNEFLKALDVTFYRDRRSGRPRINKPGCVADREQKKEGRYFYAEV